MNRYIIYNNNKIYYKIIISKRKTTCIEIKDASIIIRTNKFTNKAYLKSFLIKNIDKILKILETQENKLYNNKSIIKIFGKDYKINILDKKIDYPYIEKDTFNIYIDKNEIDINTKIDKIIDNYYLSILEPYVIKSFDNFKNITNLFPNKITIKK